MAFIVCLIGAFLTYTWLTGAVKYGGFIALGALAITARLLKFAFSNVDPRSVFPVEREQPKSSHYPHNSLSNPLGDFNAGDLTDPKNPMSQNPEVIGSSAWMATSHDDHTD
ncbi:hypothetical protein BZG19_15385 [Salinivibrio kushneri]|nr:hypothetical protein BZG19_15385 [Salinivibrio kushneri]